MEGTASKSRGVAELEWAVEPARCGDPTLAVGGHAVHSRYDPLREAAACAERAAAELAAAGADAAILLGLGLGYLPAALRERFAGELLIWDPFPEMTDCVPLQGGAWQASAALESSPAAVGSRLEAWLRRGRRPLPLIHPGYTEICRFEWRWLQRRLSGKRVRHAADCVVSERALEALVRWPARHSLAELERCCAGRTAIIVGAGPSLEASLEALAQRSGGVVFAAPQALQRLGQAGVHVDFVVAPDPHETSRILSGFEPRFAWLLAEATIEPEVLDRWPERTALFALRGEQLSDLAWRANGCKPIDEPLNTVSETALVLAHRLGARRFVLLGVDLGGAEKGRFLARSSSGAPIPTYPHYFHAARYLSHRCPELRQQGCDVWRIGEGVAIAGTQSASAAGLPRLLAAEPAFQSAAATRGVDPERWRIAHDLLCEAARTPPAGLRRGAAPDVDPENRWSVFAELPAAARAAACQAALARLDAMRPDQAA